MARPREFDPNTTLDVITNVFWTQGFEETSLEDIVQNTGVSRYGLYGAFGNKKEMLKAAIWRYAERMLSDYARDLRQETAGREELEAYFASIIERAKSDDPWQGCFICKTIAEVAPHDEEIAETIEQLFETMVGIFRNAIENGQKAGDIRTDLNADQVARGLMTTKIGITMLLNAKSPASNIEDAIKTALRVLD